MKVSKETIIRTIILVVALVNQILVTANKNPLPFSDEQLYEIISIVVTAGVSIWAWWKNNSFTKEAIEADAIMKERKLSKKEEDLS